jgi:hypothetical protein
MRRLVADGKQHTGPLFPDGRGHLYGSSIRRKAAATFGKELDGGLFLARIFSFSRNRHTDNGRYLEATKMKSKALMTGKIAKRPKRKKRRKRSSDGLLTLLTIAFVGGMVYQENKKW